MGELVVRAEVKRDRHGEDVPFVDGGLSCPCDAVFVTKQQDPPQEKETARSLVAKARLAMGVTATELAKLHGVSPKTIGRWLRGETSVSSIEIGELAPLVYPYDPQLSQRMFDFAREDAVLSKLSPPPGLPQHEHEPPTPVPPPLVLPVLRPLPPLSVKARTDAVVCAACDAIDVSPRVLRPALLAAVREARELNLSLEEIEQQLAPRAPSKPAKKT